MSPEEIKRVRFITHIGNGDTYVKGRVFDYKFNGEELSCVPYASLTKNKDTLYLRLVDDYSGFEPAELDFHLAAPEDTPFGLNLDKFTVCKLKIDGKWEDCEMPKLY